MISPGPHKTPKKNPSSLVKAFFLIAFFTCLFQSANALVSTYTFASSTGNYAAISGTTHFSGAWDDTTTALITIPFTFTYNGTAYTTLAINSNGFITLGGVPATVYCGLQSSSVNSIAGYGTDLVGTTGSTVQSGVRGSAPNRQFVIQWTNCDHYNNANVNHWVFQIVLNETSNQVQVVWGTTTDVTTMGANACADVGTESGNVGLLGGSAQDFNIRSVTNGPNTWATSVQGANLSAVCNMSSTNIPAAGQTYTWTPGAIVPMSYTSSTTLFLNNGQSLAQNTAGNQIIQMQVLVAGTTSPFTVSSLSLSTTGCTNAGTDLTNAKVYFTGINNTFSSSVQFGSTVTNPNGTYTVNGSAVLSEGINYFWVTYDIKASATFGDAVSGCCTQITGSGTMGTKIPTVTCPAGSQTIASVGTWTPLAHTAPSASGGLMLQLSDGTVIAKSSSGTADGIGNVWNKLTPDIHGSYVNGTWSTIASMISTRLYFSSQVLKDGRVYVAGGEYGTGGALGEVYNPLTNTWTATPAPGSTVSDANSEILSDGRVVQALVAGSLTGTLLYNPTTNTYATGPSTHGIHNESAWVKLADNSVLYIDRLSTASERYIPATNTWVVDGTVPVQLYDAFGDEAGGAVLLPDGRAFFLGSSGHTAYYTPSGSASPGTWAAGPDIPSGKGTPDAPAAMMVNGKILCAVSPIPTNANHFPSPTTFYEFDYLTNTYTSIPAPNGASSLNEGSYVQNFLDLPDGSILYNDQGNTQYYVYTPGSAALAAGKPAIANVTSTTCTTYQITGTQFNGISQGATYGDDWQMATNYPLVRLTSGTNVYYARTSNWNSTGVQRGAAADTVSFSLPAGLPAGTYSLVVVANGIASNPVSFTPGTPTLSSSLTPSAICTNTAFTYTPTSGSAGATFSWTRAAVSGISNAAITTAQSANPNEVLINTTSSPVTVVYAYTTTVSGCGSGTQNVSVVVNPLPLASTLTAGGATTFCAGSSVVISGNSTAGTWSIGGGTTATKTASASGDYFVTNTNACGSTTSNHIVVTVNPLPTASVITAAGNTTFCAGGSVNLNGNTTAGTWSVGGGTTTSLTASTSNDYFVTTTNSCGSTTSNHIIVTVNPLPTASVITAAGNTTFCAGGSVTLNGNTTAGTWSIGGGATSTLSASTAGDYFTTTTNSCGSTTSNHILVTINPLPTPSVISAAGNITFCDGGSVNINGNTTAGTWSIGGGTSTSLTASTAGDYFVTTTNSCGSTTSNHIIITVNPLPTVIASNASGCAGTPIQLTATPAGGNFNVSNPYTGASTSFTYTYTNGNGCTNSSTASITVNALPVVSFSGLASSYQVTDPAATLTGSPAGGTFSGNGISGNTFTPLTAGTGGPYTVTYSYTNGNGCTNSTSQQTTVGGCSAPAQPATITMTGGIAKVCPGDVRTYKVALVSGATIYNWTVPTGAVISSGGGTRIISVTYNSGFTASGTISVTAGNNCGNSLPRTLLISPNTPARPTVIIGTINGACANTSGTYSVTAVAGVNFIWTVPANASILSGQGTNSVSISFGANFTSGTLSVYATNNCSTSITRTATLTSTPAIPLAITGSTKNNCSATKTYSIAAVANATSYTWSTSIAGAVITPSGTSAVVNFPVFSTGTISVTANNGCGSSAPKVLTVKGTVAPPVSITGNSAVTACNDEIYATPAITGATSYLWTVPTGNSIVSGQGTNSIVVHFAGISGSITVKGVNGCGASTAASLPVTISSCARMSSATNTNVNVYPNPSNGLFNLEIAAAEAGNCTISVTDVLGRTVNTITPVLNQGSNHFEINLSNAAKGVYFAKIHSATFENIVRLVIE